MRLNRIHRIKKLLDRIAYISLFFDVAIAMITLLSIRIFVYEPATLLAYVNYGLTIVVLIGAFLFLLKVLAKSLNLDINMQNLDKIIERTAKTLKELERQASGFATQLGEGEDKRPSYIR